MTNFASIKFIHAYEKVTYYSIVVNEEEGSKSLFEDFIEQFSLAEVEKLNHILFWIRQIGDKYGAQNHLFREENFEAALPPNGIMRQPVYKIDGRETSNPLRLYCLRLNEAVVVLFGGGIKTAAKAQECENVSNHFFLANKLSKLFDESMKNGDIEWEVDHSDILFEQNFKLYY